MTRGAPVLDDRLLDGGVVGDCGHHQEAKLCEQRWGDQSWIALPVFGADEGGVSSWVDARYCPANVVFEQQLARHSRSGVEDMGGLEDPRLVAGHRHDGVPVAAKVGGVALICQSLPQVDRGPRSGCSFELRAPWRECRPASGPEAAAAKDFASNTVTLGTALRRNTAVIKPTSPPPTTTQRLPSNVWRSSCARVSSQVVVFIGGGAYLLDRGAGRVDAQQGHPVLAVTFATAVLIPRGHFVDSPSM